jgi:cyclic 2,3-diphosphoglycerate synthase
VSEPTVIQKKTRPPELLKAIALIDGEHHPAVTRDALDRLALEHDLQAILFVGGEEKVSERVLADPVSTWGRDVKIGSGEPADALRALAAGVDAEVVIDLSGAPVLDNAARLRLASVALHLGLEYRAAGLRLTPPPRERLPFRGPVIEVIGTGKRTGKTAVAGHYAALLRDHGSEPVVVAMGRGGPAQPQLVRAEERPDLQTLLAIARAGGHAASDYLEDALLTGVSCVGCRRCGDGPAGETFESNVLEGAKLALSLDPDVLLFEGSGAALPPIEADRTVCVTGAAHTREEALSYLGPYRLMRSHLVLVVGADCLPASGLSELKRSLGAWCGNATVIGCRLEPEPTREISPAARAAFFSTAAPEHEPELREALGRRGVDVRVYSSNLARRSELRLDLERAQRERCDVYLTEIKAAAIELVAEEADRRGVELVPVRNRPIALGGEPELDDELVRLLGEAREAAVGEGAVEARRR